MHIETKRHFPIGAELIPDKGVHFRVWAPDHENVQLVLEADDASTANHASVSYPMHKENEGYFSILSPQAKEGSLYRFRLSNADGLYPDPASRFQPQGPNGPSCVINPAYAWTDQNWKGIQKEEQIIYEIHIGTFTPEGTFEAARKQLKELADLGVTILEIMPLNDFPGRFGWGYDGVNLFAPKNLYGTPQEVKAFIDDAHRLKLNVIIDVVYNHFGPEYNFLLQFSKHYLNDNFVTEWGQAINLDKEPAREFFLTNVRYWIEEFHFDGLRVDATSCLFSSNPIHFMQDLTQVAKQAAGKKKIIIIGENEPQDVKLIKKYSEQGYEFDSLWNDDFHHCALVRLTGKREAYYMDYLGTAQEFISLMKHGFLYQGQFYTWQNQLRGTSSLNLPSTALVNFLENHDQVANSGDGTRLHAISDPGNYKALTALLLLGRSTPMLFQGQEFKSSRPFVYFSDHDKDLNRLVKKGRKKFLGQFHRLNTPEMKKSIPDPSALTTFLACKLDFHDRKRNVQFYQLHKDLIQLRKEDPVFKNMSQIKIDGAVLNQEALLIRYFGEHEDRLLIINFGVDLVLKPCPEPLLAAGLELEWEILWASEWLKYKGQGVPKLNFSNWTILGHSAMVLKTVKIKTKKL